MELSFSLVTEIVQVLAAVVNAGVILPVFQKLRQSERTNMASFQLNPEETLMDFKVFFSITVIFLVSISLLILGRVLNNPLIEAAGSILSMISGFMPIYVFYRWWRRFQ